MDFQAKIRSIPASPGVYLYKNAEGEVIYVGKAKSLRHRVSSYFHEGRVADAKTGTLLREAVDVDYIVVANNKEALALENHLIKQRQPRFNILLRDDKTYPYVKLTLGERFPRVYVTRRLKKDDSAYYGPYFPANLAYRIVDLIHMRGGRVLDRREFFWEDLPEFENSPEELSRDANRASGHVGTGALARPVEQRSAIFDPSQFFSQFLAQLYIGQPYVPRNVYV